MSRGSEFQNSLSAKLQYSNDCKFLAESARKLQTQYETGVLVKSQEFESVATRFEEVADKLDVMSSSWFDESIVSGFHISTSLRLLNTSSFRKKKLSISSKSTAAQTIYEI